MGSEVSEEERGRRRVRDPVGSTRPFCSSPAFKSTTGLDPEGADAGREPSPSSRAGSRASSAGAPSRASSTKRPAEEADAASVETDVMDVVSGASSSVSESDPPKKKRKGRERPCVDPSREGQFTAAKIVEREEGRREKALGEIEAEILDPLVPPSGDRLVKVRANATEMAVELRDEPVAHIAAVASESLATLQKAVGKSRNLSGPVAGAMWRSVETLIATNSLLLRRATALEEVGCVATAPTGSVIGGEMEDLRVVVSAQNREIAALKKELEGLRAVRRCAEVGSILPPPPSSASCPPSAAAAPGNGEKDDRRPDRRPRTQVSNRPVIDSDDSDDGTCVGPLKLPPSSLRGRWETGESFLSMSPSAVKRK